MIESYSLKEVYYIGDTAKDFLEFRSSLIEDYQPVGGIDIQKVHKTFVRGVFQLDPDAKRQAWYRDYLKGQQTFFYVEEFPLFDTLRYNPKEGVGELYFANPKRFEASKPFKIFVAMPFDQKHDDTIDAIREVGDKLRQQIPDLEIYRLDMHEGESVNLPNEIYKNIAEAGIIISDLSDCNPNVYYELGIADALSKKVIQICRDKSDLRFDVAHKKTIIFPTLGKLKDRLERDIRAIYSAQP